MEWQNIVNLESLELERGKGQEPYKYDYHRPATRIGAKKLGFNVATVPSGQFSSPYHFHHSEEELFLILEGSGILRQVDRYREVRKGDLIFFTNGPEGAHQFFNNTRFALKILAISTMDGFEVAEYPDSKKVYVSKIKKVFQADSEVEYLVGEANPAQYWPKEFLQIV